MIEKDVLIEKINSLQHCLERIQRRVKNSNLFDIPQALKDNFKFLEEKKTISSELAQTMIKMVGFRNGAVHDYQAVVQKHLSDFEAFYQAIAKKYLLTN